MNRLKELYESIEKLKNLGCNLSDSIDEINRLEEELIINEIIPTLKDAISPIINQIQRELLLVVEYTPNTPLVVKPTKKRSFAIPQELDSGVEKKYSISPHTKNKKTNLKVIFPDGKTIQNKKASETFVETIKIIGVEKVKNLELQINKISLVSDKKSNKYIQHPLGNYFIITHSSTKNKKSCLDDISKKLNLNLDVQII